MADFSNAKVGDKVWDLILGECEVDFIKDKKIHIIHTTKDNSKIRLSYDLKGFCNPEIKVQMLYHSKPQIIEAKRMVKKEVQGVIIEKRSFTSTLSEFVIHTAFIQDVSLQNIPCTITFEVEE